MAGWIVAAAWVVVASAFTGWVTAVDKRRAQRGAARVREADLLILALVGGSPGLVAAMVAFHHKTRKTRFLVKVALVILVQALFVYLAIAVGP